MFLETDSLNASYKILLKNLVKNFNKNEKVTLLNNLTILLKDPKKRTIYSDTDYCKILSNTLLNLQGRNLNEENTSIGNRLFRYDSMFDVIDTSYMDDEGNSHPAFDVEHLVFNQFESSCKELEIKDKTTITFFNPNEENELNINMLQFKKDGNKLNCYVFFDMLSVLDSFIEETFLISLLHELFSSKAGYELGTLTFYINSLSSNNEDIEIIKKVSKNKIELADKILPANLDKDTIDSELLKVYEVEAVTRVNGHAVTLEDIEGKLYNIKNMYWRSYAAAVAYYNFKTYYRKQEELDILHKYIGNEFFEIIEEENAKK